MSATIKRSAAFMLALVTVMASVAFVFPHSISVSADESTTPIADEASLKAALEGEGGSYSLSSSIAVTVSEYEEYRYTVSKSVTLDLNGFSIEVTNTANLSSNTADSTLIKVENGGSLKITDSSSEKTGGIAYKGGIHLFSEKTDYKPFAAVTGRHLIYLCEGASLTVNGGSLSAGNVETEWLHRAAGIVDKAFEYYTGFAENTVCGTVITASGKSSVTINGGTLTAHGRKRQNILPNLKGWDEEMPVSVTVKAAAEATVNINDGCFVGANGADVFSFDADSETLVMAGKFETTPSENERIADYMTFAAVNTEQYYGRINLPTVFIPKNSRDALSQSGAPIDKVSDAVNGAPVYLTPYTANTTITSSPSLTTSYAPGAAGKVLANYKPYFTEGSTVNYIWYAVSANGTVTPVNGSDSSTLDLSKLSSLGVTISVGSKYSFICVITERLGSYTLTTVARSFSLETKNKYILAAIKLTPSSINDDNFYYSGKLPSFSVPSNVNYSLSSVKWYEGSSKTPISDSASLKPNSRYYLVFTLKAKGNYLFTSSTRVSFLAGGNDIMIVPSSDSKSATVSAWVYTACDHSKTDYVIDETSHTKLCTLCGKVISCDKHTYTPWSEAVSAITETAPEQTDPTVTDPPVTSTQPPETGTDPSESETAPPESGTEPPETGTNPPEPPDPPVPPTPPTFEAVPMQRICTVCSHLENSAVYAPVEGHKTPIYEVKIDFGSHMASSAMKTPVLLSTPDSSKLTILSHAWTDESGASASAFASGSTYNLTVKFAVSDEESYVFGNDTVISSLTPAAYSVTYSDDMTEMTVVYKVKTSNYEKKEVYLPVVKSGQSIVNNTTSITGSVYTIYWYRDGVLIGHVSVNNDKRTGTDDNPADGIEFPSAVFDAGHIYHSRIHWTVASGNSVSTDAVTFTYASDIDHDVCPGEFGFVTAYYLPFNNNSVVRTVKVSDISVPTAGGTPKTSGATVSTGCKVKSIAFTCNGKSVSKFECGNQYTVKVTLSAASGYSLSVTAGSINGEGASVSTSGSNVVLTYTFQILNHDFDHRNAEIGYPSCISSGSISAKCKSCSDACVISLSQFPHITERISAKDATCSSDGVVEHYGCISCFKLFGDKSASSEITKESTVLAKDTAKHIEYSVLVHDGNDHYAVCTECSAPVGDKTRHKYGNEVFDAQGNAFYSCACGHYISELGPKIPEFVIGGTDETIENTGPSEDLFNFGSFSLKTVKMIIIIMAAFIILLIGSIIAISVILIVTRDKSGKQPLPDETETKENTVTTANTAE